MGAWHQNSKKMKAKDLNIIRGKGLVGKATKADVLWLIIHIDALEGFLDEYDQDDTFGTEGWRHALGID
jgi:hypothetical protein